MPRRKRLALAAVLTCGVACGDSGSDLDPTGDATTTGTCADEATTGVGVGDWYEVLALDTDQGALLSVWGEAPHDVWAVGGQMDPDTGTSTGIIYHYDGCGTFTRVGRDDFPMLNWVFGVDGDVWAVGLDGTALRREVDGTWTREETGTTETLWGVWGVASNDVWAVGGDGVASDPVLLHYDGTAWSVEVVPDLGVESHGLFKVWGTAADDVLIVGDVGVTLHFDGNSWTPHDSGSVADLISLWGTGPSDVVAVGGRSDARVVRWDGAGWSGQGLAEPGLNGVWVDAEGVATAVGRQGAALRVSPGGFEYEVEPTNSFDCLHAVFGFENGLRFAVGGRLLSPPLTGLILRKDG